MYFGQHFKNIFTKKNSPEDPPKHPLKARKGARKHKDRACGAKSDQNMGKVAKTAQNPLDRYVWIRGISVGDQN